MQRKQPQIPSKQLQDEWSEMLAVWFQMISKVSEELMKAALKHQFESTMNDFDVGSAIKDPHFHQHAQVIQEMAIDEIKKRYN